MSVCMCVFDTLTGVKNSPSYSCLKFQFIFKKKKVLFCMYGYILEYIFNLYGRVLYFIFTRIIFHGLTFSNIRSRIENQNLRTFILSLKNYKFLWK